MLSYKEEFPALRSIKYLMVLLYYGFFGEQIDTYFLKQVAVAPSTCRAGTNWLLTVFLNLISPSPNYLSPDCAQPRDAVSPDLLTSQKICCGWQNELLFVISENEENNLYVATCNPVSLYFMDMAGKTGYFVDFFDIFPRTASGVWHPFVTVAPLGNPLKGQLILHEQQVMHPRPLTWYNYAKGNFCEGRGKNDLQPVTEKYVPS